MISPMRITDGQMTRGNFLTKEHWAQLYDMVLLAGIQFFHLLVEGPEAGYSISLILHLLIC